MTPLDIEAEIKGQIQHLKKDSQAMTSNQLFSHYKPLRAMTRVI